MADTEVHMSSSAPTLIRSKAAALYAGAGVALLAAQALLPAYPSDVAGQVSVAASHRGAETAAVVSFLVAGALLAMAVAASTDLRLIRGRALARAGLLLTGIGALWPVAGRASFTAILVALTGSAPGSAVSAVHAIGDSPAFAVFLPLLLAFVVGPILLAAGLWRAGLLPVWLAPLWLAGVLVVNAAEDSSRIVAAGGMLLVAGVLVRIGKAVTASNAAAAS
jgi:hypothetical protein